MPYQFIYHLPPLYLCLFVTGTEIRTTLTHVNSWICKADTTLVLTFKPGPPKLKQPKLTEHWDAAGTHTTATGAQKPWDFLVTFRAAAKKTSLGVFSYSPGS